MPLQLPPTYCNPLSIEDIPSGRFLDCRQTHVDPRTVRDYRSISDPSVVFWEGKWILYPSYSLAYVSSDFIHWAHVDIGIPELGYSPAVARFRGKWYLLGYARPELYRADSPLGPFKPCGLLTNARGQVHPVVDACLLADGDRLFIYYHSGVASDGSADVEGFTATAGVELDPDEPWKMLGEPVILNRFDPGRVWQRTGEYNQNERMGWIEGQWATKVGGRYYLMYSGAGTEYSTYANGILVSDKGPLTGFRPQTHHDPLAEKRSGLVRGAGHGCIVRGPNDTLWMFYTCVFCFNHRYERRICMDPLGIDKNGELFCPAATETPQFAPGVLPHPEGGNGAGLLPLTFMQRPSATSHAEGREPLYASDESVLTWWQPAADDVRPVITFELGRGSAYVVEALRIIWRDIGMETLDGIGPGPFRYVVEYAADPGFLDWHILVDASRNSRDLCIDYRTFAPTRAHAVRLAILGAPKGITPGLVSLTAFGKCAHEPLPPQ